MKPSHLSLGLVLLAGLTAAAGAQVTPPAPAAPPTGVPLERLTLPSEQPAAEKIDLPEVEYPKAVTAEQQKAVEKHEEGSQELSFEQDELSADVQELIDEQTDEKVIQLLELVEQIMAEVTESLDQTDTGGGTIAAETEIIEKIFEAAQQRAQQNGGT